MDYIINKQKCLGINRCGICLRNCPGATQEGDDGKAEVIDPGMLEQCGGVNVCPMGAIEMIGQEGTQVKGFPQRSPFQFTPNQNVGFGAGRGLGLGGGRGMGAGGGRGMGLGPRDGRGGGRGGGGRRG